MAGTRPFKAFCVISRRSHLVIWIYLHIWPPRIYLRINIFMRTHRCDPWRGETDLATPEQLLKRRRLPLQIAGGDRCKRRRPQPTHLGDIKQTYVYGTSTHRCKLLPTTWNTTIRLVLVEILPKQGQWGHTSTSIVPKSKEPIVLGRMHRPKRSQTFP